MRNWMTGADFDAKKIFLNKNDNKLGAAGKFYSYLQTFSEPHTCSRVP